jgi:hypothetical protein
VPVSRVVKFNDDIIKTDVTVKLYNRKFLNFIIIGDLDLDSRQDCLTCMYSGPTYVCGSTRIKIRIRITYTKFRSIALDMTYELKLPRIAPAYAQNTGLQY